MRKTRGVSALALLVVAPGAVCHAATGRSTFLAASGMSLLRRLPRTFTARMEVVELDASNFANTIAANEGLAVVEFYAPYCRLCKRIAPAYAREVSRMESDEQYKDVTFYKVNFKESQEVAFRERVLALPTFHFYAPFASRRINRFVVKPNTFGQQLRHELDRYVGDSGHLALLQSLSDNPAPLSPLTRFGLLSALLTALENVDEFLEEAAREEQLTTIVGADERRLAELKDLFNWVDANSDGVINAEELAAVAAAVGSGVGGAAPSGGFFDALLQHAQEAAYTQEAASVGEWVVARPGTLDFEAFVRIMTSKTVTEWKVPECELKPVFSTLDANQDGSISKEELMAAMHGVWANLAHTGAGAFTAKNVEDAFDAADRSKAGVIDYEGFVAVMSDMTVAKITTV